MSQVTRRLPLITYNEDSADICSTSSAAGRNSLRQPDIELGVIRASQESLVSKSEPTIVGQYAVRETFAQRIKKSCKTKVNKVKRWYHEWGTYLTIWYWSCKELENNFGGGVVSYFYFNRFMLKINLFAVLLVLICFVTPEVISSEPKFSWNQTVNLTSERDPTGIRHSLNCSQYIDKLVEDKKSSSKPQDIALSIFVGTGFMENTPIFIGYYKNTIHLYKGNDSLDQFGSDQPVRYSYNIALAWLIIYWVVIVTILVASLHSSGKNFRDYVVTQAGGKSTFSFMVLTAWDYSICKKKRSAFKHKEIARNLRTELAAIDEQKMIANRSTKQRILIYSIRVTINVLFAGFIVGVYYLIEFCFSTADKLNSELLNTADNDIKKSAINFLPSAAITGVNFIFPIACDFALSIERYTISQEIQMKIWRHVIVRMASLLFFILNIVIKVRRIGEGQPTFYCAAECWETYIGQECYRLAVVDFVMKICVPLFVQLPRSLLYNCLEQKSRLLKMIGKIEFDLPLRALDLIYSQAICWLGFFFCPLLPFLTSVNLIALFYITKFLLLRNHVIVNTRTFQAARSERFFLDCIVAVISFTLIPMGYFFSSKTSSRGCSPYRIFSPIRNSTISDAFYVALSQASAEAGNFFNFFTSLTVQLIVVVCLCLLMYYFTVQSAGSKKLIALLKQGLAAEGKDKNFLVGRLMEIQEALIAKRLDNPSTPDTRKRMQKWTRIPSSPALSQKMIK